MRFPWKRTVSDEEVVLATKKLSRVKAQQPEVDAIERRAKELVRRNHLGENIHKALGGHL